MVDGGGRGGQVRCSGKRSSNKWTELRGEKDVLDHLEEL